MTRRFVVYAERIAGWVEVDAASSWARTLAYAAAIRKFGDSVVRVEPELYGKVGLPNEDRADRERGRQMRLQQGDHDGA